MSAWRRHMHWWMQTPKDPFKFRIIFLFFLRSKTKTSVSFVWMTDQLPAERFTIKLFRFFLTEMVCCFSLELIFNWKGRDASLSSSLVMTFSCSCDGRWPQIYAEWQSNISLVHLWLWLDSSSLEFSSIASKKCSRRMECSNSNQLVHVLKRFCEKWKKRFSI